MEISLSNSANFLSNRTIGKHLSGSKKSMLFSSSFSHSNTQVLAPARKQASYFFHTSIHAHKHTITQAHKLTSIKAHTHTSIQTKITSIQSQACLLLICLNFLLLFCCCSSHCWYIYVTCVACVFSLSRSADAVGLFDVWRAIQKERRVISAPLTTKYVIHTHNIQHTLYNIHITHSIHPTLAIQKSAPPSQPSAFFNLFLTNTSYYIHRTYYLLTKPIVKATATYNTHNRIGFYKQGHCK